MKRIVLFASLLAALVLSLGHGLSAHAAPNGKTTLAAGDRLKIVPGNCKLAVTKNTVSLVKVKCKAAELAVAAAAAESVAGVPPIFLTAGQSHRHQRHSADPR